MTASERSSGRLPKIAVLPLGATEQHGPHLPAETDTLIAEAVAARAAAFVQQEIDLEVLPAEPVGYSPEHLGWPVTRSLGHAEAIERWIEIGQAVAARGIDRFVMLNAHGGNSPLVSIVATELRVRSNMLAVGTSWTRFAYPVGLVSEEEKAHGIHGGFIETSVLLALRPDLVAMDKAERFPNRQRNFEHDFTHLRAYGSHFFGWKMGDLSATGVAGDAAAASAEAGEQLLDNAAQGLADLLRDVARFDISLFR